MSIIVSPLAIAARALYPREYHNFKVSLFGVYFDESGTHEDSPILCVSGCISSVEQWDRLEIEWCDALKDFGIPYVHMADLMNDAYPFKGFSSKERIAILERFTGIMNRRISLIVSSCFKKSSWNLLVDKYGQKVKSQLVKPYTIAALAAMTCVKEWAEQWGHEGPMLYVFEDGVTGRGDLFNGFNHRRTRRQLRAAFRMMATCPLFADKVDVKQLQAADICVYHTWNWIRGRPLRDSRFKQADTFFRQLLKVPMRPTEMVEEEAIKKLIQLHDDVMGPVDSEP